MGSAIAIGQTGLSASSKQMEVIGNNLSNTNTVGFKASSTHFNNMMNQGLSSAGTLAAGQGVEVVGMPTQFIQGSLESTSNATDMAIDGEGFFIVKDRSSIPLYTRAGAFHIDKHGKLVDNKGFTVQGYAVQDDVLSTVPTDIFLQKAKDATATAKVSFGANLNETTDVDNEFVVSQNVYDSKGGVHILSITFSRTVDSAGDVVPGGWNYTSTFDDIPLVASNDGTIQFAADGTYTAAADVDISIVGVDAASELLIDGKLKGASIGTGATKIINWAIKTEPTEKLTGYASTSVLRSLNSDGFASGDLRSLSIDSNGVINGVYSNGQLVELAQICLANFLDPSALKKNGNYFGETTGSGNAIPNPAGSGGLGEIQSNSLESSNTDVAKEFVNMITAQRAYQASAKIITTADNMLTELMNIKR